MVNYLIVTYQASKFEFIINYNIGIYRHFIKRLLNRKIATSMFQCFYQQELMITKR